MAVHAMQTRPVDGSLDISVGFAFNKAGLLNYLNGIKDRPEDYYVEDRYIHPGTHTDGIVQAVDRVFDLANKNITYEVRNVEFELTLHFEDMESPLPLDTVYDILGWIMSVSWQIATPTPQSTSRNYYMPLLALYARWCRLLSPPNDKNQMVSIAWYTDPSRIILGSTIGTPYAGISSVPAEDRSLAKATIITRERQQCLNEAGLHAAVPEQVVKLDGSNIGSGGYGTCAETFFFIYQSTNKARIDNTRVKGLAMVPSARHGEADTEYTERTAAEALKPPCTTSCQHLIRQCDPHWLWAPSFGVRNLKLEVAVSPDLADG